MNIAVALCLVAIITSVFWGLGLQNNDMDVMELIAEEVVYKHLKMTPLEVAATSLNDMRDYFS